MLQIPATENKFQGNSACVGMLLQFVKLFCLKAWSVQSERFFAYSEESAFATLNEHFKRRNM